MRKITDKIYVVAENPDPHWQYVTQAIAEGYWYNSMTKAKAELKRAKAEYVIANTNTVQTNLGMLTTKPVNSPFKIYTLTKAI